MGIAADDIRLEPPGTVFAAACLDARREGFTDAWNSVAGPPTPVDEEGVEAHLASLNRPVPALPGTAGTPSTSGYAGTEGISATESGPPCVAMGSGIARWPSALRTCGRAALESSC